MDKLIRSLGVIFLSLALGYFIQILVRRKILSSPDSLESLRKVLQIIAFLLLDPIIYISTVWTVNLHEVRYTALPLLCLFGLLLGGTLAFLISRWRQMPRKQAGIYIIDGGITNLGTIGGLVTFTFLGEAGVALVSIYRLFEMFTYYSVAFPIAKSYSQETRESMGIWERIKQTVRDPFVWVSLGSILIGFYFEFFRPGTPGLLCRPQRGTDSTHCFGVSFLSGHGPALHPGAALHGGRLPVGLDQVHHRPGCGYQPGLWAELWLGGSGLAAEGGFDTFQHDGRLHLARSAHSV